MDAVIDAHGLGKRYRLGQVETGLRRLRRRLTGDAPQGHSWALRDVSFEVHEGTSLAVVGRNGAGKSTLLKLLSRITEPTTGYADIAGRVGALLEIGTGFHGELTGRENVYLNGAILGMSRAEISRKFDEIAAFAEVDRFLDTPVKRYSSGMQVRLAFAVAAHLEPDVLIVDEVLAVGDANFQKKCLGRMRHVAAEDGRTVLFVSHHLGALSSLCTRGVLLDDGKVQVDTDIHTALSVYLNATSEQDVSAARPSTRPRIVRVTLDEEALRQGTLEVRIAFVSPFDLCPPIGGVTVTDSNGVAILGTNTRMHPQGYSRPDARSGVLVCRIPRLPLHSGEYGISAWLADMHQDFDAAIGVLTFYFSSPDFRPEIPPTSAVGPVNVDATWDCVPFDTEAPVASTPGPVLMRP